MYKDYHGYNVIGILLEDGKLYKLSEHRVNTLLEHSLKEVCENHIHHKNGIKIDNRIENLELLSHSEHIYHHRKGNNHSEKTKQKMSKCKKYNKNSFNPCIKIRKKKKKEYKQGYTWIANPCTNDKRICISSVSLDKCVKRVEDFINSKENTKGYTSYKIIKEVNYDCR